ncbi:hypothetical protein RHGRI_003690 [Rhododendron griersonianum]|uniref:AAA+ ATPase domain-containing protein n=1 Tax=Rhododendron griersonianum TaxID=479676 RepID=A0AAV6L5Z1_9ERIC|nr:hypothetical protein RHGRI_003690 [Rhododendron griersonianum]
MYFVCVKCYDAGETYDLCCKCYGDKSYNHQDDHTYFRDIHSLLQLRKPKPASAIDQDPEEEKLRAGLNSAIIWEKPNVKWNDMAGLESAKQALQEAVMLPVKFPQFFAGKRRPWRAFLLYGPPGTGKSHLAKAIATEADSTFFSISSSDLVSKWMGESEKSSSDDDKVLVLAATNTLYALDQAIRRRFNRRIYIPLPDLKARQHMLKDVLFEPVRKTQAAMYFVKTRDDMWMQCEPKQPGAVQTTMHGLAAKGLASKITLPPITKMDFDKVLARQRPTVSKADLEVHERFTKEFGEEG